MIEPLKFFTSATGPPLSLRLRKSGAVLDATDLDGYTIELTVINPKDSSVKFKREGTISGTGEDTRVVFAWEATDWDTAGEFFGQLILIDGDGAESGFDEYLRFIVKAKREEAT